MTDRWSLGVLIGLPALTIGLLVLACILVKLIRSDQDDAVIVGFLLVGVLVGAGILYWPWKVEYHHWQHVAGQVKQVQSRFLSKDHGTEQRFVVVFTDNRIRSCDDTRCSLLKPHDHLDLSCKRKWQWTGTPGWDCNYVRSSEDGPQP